MNETSGPLQQHLHLNAGATPTYVEVRETIMEYYGATTALSRLHQQPGSSSPRRTGTYGHWSCQQRIQRKVQQRKRGRSPTKEKEKAKATKAKDTATGTTKAKERLDKECRSKERSTKEDT